MKTKVLMINPRVPSTTFWNLAPSLAMMRKRFMSPPLGLLTVGALLPPERYEATLIDMNTSDLSRSAIQAADLVFVSAMLVQKSSFEEVLAICNGLGKPVVAGGSYPTACHREILSRETPRVDHLVLDEAEISLPPFLADFRDGRAQRVYRAERRPDLSITPLPRWSLIDVGQYETMAVQYSRGCPHDCEFCDISSLFGRKVRTKRVDQFLRELDAVYATGFRGTVFIVDDNFIGKRIEVREVLRNMASWQRERQYPFSITVQATLDAAHDEELLALLVDAGVRQVFVGIETPVAETLTAIGKTQNLGGSILRDVEVLQSRGIEVLAGFIVGFDTDPEDVFERQAALIREACIPVALVEILSVLPNTRLHARMLQENRLVTGRTGNNAHEMKVNYVPRIPANALVASTRKVIAELYSPRAYFERCLGLLRRFPKELDMPSPHPFPRKGLASLWARSLARQGLSFYALDYLKFVVRVLLAHRAHLPQAVHLAIRGDDYIRRAKALRASA